MIEWSEEGVLLAARKHGENSMIVELLTRDHGRHAGVVRGGTSRKIAPLLQPGNAFAARWKARLEDHLGAFTLEPTQQRAALHMSDRLALAGLTSVASLLSFALPEREAHPDLYDRSIAMFDMLGQDFWHLAYVRWELALLEDVGYRLSLDQCAVTGACEGLVYVSPKSGRAVSEDGVGEFRDRMLPLAPALLGKGDGTGAESAAALAVTGHFLQNHLAAAIGSKPLPAARQRLIDLLARDTG